MRASVDDVKRLKMKKGEERDESRDGQLTQERRPAGTRTGTGRITSLFPARSAMWRYSGTPFSAAPALHTARLTPRIALAPNLAVVEIKCDRKVNEKI